MNSLVGGSKYQVETRRSHRRRTLKCGRIRFNEDRCTMDIRILNMSDSGLKLETHTIWPCPSSFTVEISNPNSNCPEVRECELVWQKGLEAGVRFRDSA
ncbi:MULTISPECIES: PilZ domain-containing protein [Hyphomonas]|uniref:PilZ domain-containing protein n=1 Tax=Hyphomonas TaxID=85 RepID=UPI003519C2D5